MTAGESGTLIVPTVELEGVDPGADLSATQTPDPPPPQVVHVETQSSGPGGRGGKRELTVG